MPSTIAPINSTRASSVRPAQGLRYGNFEGVRNLPPVRTSDGISEQNFWAINNEQICSTVCQWMENWQPWQQRTLLCGVANRSTVGQLEIFSTILEPLNHRDYKTQALRRYPSAPFRVNKPSKGKRKKKQTKNAQSAKSNISPKIPLIVTDDVGNITDVRTITGLLEKEAPNDAERVKEQQQISGSENNADQSGGNKAKNATPLPEKVEKQRLETPMDLADVPMGMDQYISIMSSSILISAVHEASATGVSDTFQSSYPREPSATSRVQIEEPDESEKKRKPDQAEEKDRAVVGQSLTRESTMKSSAGMLKSRPMTRSSQASSARFLGGTLEFSTDNCYRKFWRERSCSSVFRHSAFASSVASTAEFFNKKKVSKLGPMQNTLRTGSVQRPLHLGPLPVPLQKYYKNARWWPAEPPSGTVYYQARKQELSLNFNEQLNAIWKWLSEWESYEQIAFIKKVAMMCSASVLDALLTHIQQRLRDSRDINRLPDKLLLYVFSFMPPQDILRASKVCRRWRFLCAMDELWMLKCLEIGEQGGVSNISELVQKAWEDPGTSRTTDRGPHATSVSGLGNTSISSERGSNAGALSVPGNTSRTTDRGSQMAAVVAGPNSQCGITVTGSVAGTSDAQLRLKPGPVDWMLACSQLSDLLYSARVEMAEDGVDGDRQLDRLDNMHGDIEDSSRAPAERGKKIEGKGGKGTVRIQLNTGVRERLELSKKRSSRPGQQRTPVGAALSSPNKTLDSAYGGSHSRLSDVSDTPTEEDEEDLAHLMQEYNILKGAEPVTAPQRSRSPKRSEVARRNLPEVLPEEPTPAPTHTSKSGSRATSKKTEKKDDQKDTGLDIRTDLTQSKDLLGKMVSKTSLEWETPETYNDYMRTTLFAGDLRAVKRMRKLQGHINCIHCIHFDRRRLVTCGLDRVVRLWDVRSGRALHKFYGHKGGIRCVQFDNDIMATGSWDCLILIWDMRQFTNTHTLLGHEDSVTCLEFNDDFLISGSEDHSVRLWRRPNFACMLTIWFDAPVMSLVIVDYNFIVSTLDLGIYMLDAYTGTKRRKFESPLGPVQTLTIHGQLVIGGDTAGRLCFWSLQHGELEAAVKGHGDAVTRVRFHDGRFFSASCDSTIKEWDLRTMTCLRVLKGHRGPVRDVQVSERRIISCGDDASTRIWDLVLGDSKPATLDT